MSYPYTTLWINGRLVSLNAVVHETEECRSAFEEHTFSFIREWLSGQKKFVLQTSGSTGAPKRITVTREQMEASAKLTEQALQLKRQHHALICIDTKYIGGKMMIARCLTIGMRIWAVDPTANPLSKIPVDQCVNFAAFVPLQIQTILGSKHPHSLNNLDQVIIGGAPLDEKVIEQLNTFLCRCYATYGMTETLSHVALRTLNGKNKQRYFELLPGVTVRQDERGCLVIYLPYLPEPVITNDIVELRGARQFVWLGRWDNVINSGGVKVIPEKVEAALTNLFFKAGIQSRFFVQGVEDQKFGQKVVLFVEGTDYTRELFQKLLRDPAIQLSPFEIPQEVRLIPSFVTTATGKVNRTQTLHLQE
jgi:O-succinylbenzoic acid--CoA ligase